MTAIHGSMVADIAVARLNSAILSYSERVLIYDEFSSIHPPFPPPFSSLLLFFCIVCMRARAMRAYMCLCVPACVCSCVHVCMCACMCACVRVHACMCVFVCACVRACVHACVCLSPPRCAKSAWRR